MSDVNLFSNAPLFCQKPTSTAEILSLPVFNALIQANPTTSSLQYCSDPNMGTTMIKNVLHQVIRCGGEPIDFNFMETMFPNLGMTTPAVVGSKRWFNHYVCDPDYKVYASNSVTGTAPNAPVTFQLLRANHASGGQTSFPLPGYQWVDTDTQTWYTVTAVDTSVDYAHQVTVVPNEDGVIANIRANKAYVILPGREVGGCNCPVIGNEMNTIGYTQEIRPIRIRKDWQICVDLLTGYEDKVQYAVIYDLQGNPVDSWDALEAQVARQGLRMTLNALSFIGTPTTNAALINTGGAIGVDDNHTGFYGLIPTLKYGGGNRYHYPSDAGFDLASDGEAILLYQDSRKRTKNFMVMHGLKFRMNMIDRTNNLVARQNVGATMWDAYKRFGEYSDTNDYNTTVAKLGIDSYKYQGLNLDFKKMDSWSDYRFMGSDYFNGLAIFVPQGGVKENGREISPIEFNTYGQGQWTGQYEEHFIDYRNTNGCNDIGGWVAESLAMTVHCPGQWIIAEPTNRF